MNALALSLILAAQSNCPGGVCPAPAPGAPTKGWNWREADDCETHLYIGDTCVGGFDGTVYRSWNGKAWSQPCQCPIELPKLESKKPAAVGYNGGIDLARMKDAHAPYSINGIAVSGAAAHDALGSGGALADDSGKPWIIVRTDDAKLCDEICTGLAPLADNFRISHYPPGHWALTSVNADRGLVMVMDASGKELHRQDDFQGGVPAVVEAVRKADPKYDPSKTPDLRKTPSLPGLDVVKSWFTSPLSVGGFTFPVYAAVIAAVAVVLFLRSRRK